MKKGKLCLLTASLLALTNIASCNIYFDNGDSSSKAVSSQPAASSDGGVSSEQPISSSNAEISSSEAPASSSTAPVSSSEAPASSSSAPISSNPVQPSSSSQGSSESRPAELSSISLNKSELRIMVGAKETLTVTFNPADAADKRIEWSSQNATIATVSESGEVAAKKTGQTVITATSKANPNIKASCTVIVSDAVILTAVNSKHEFVLFEQNKNKNPNADDGFYDQTQSYKVGDDNNFNVKPELTVLDRTTMQPVSASNWTYDFTISATTGGQPAGTDLFNVVDARNCDVKFTDKAVGKTFTISIAPGGVDASRVASLTKTINVDVVDGYNVYDAKELGYFDTREKDSTIDAPTLEDDTKWQCKWYDFKVANNMNPDYHPAALIIQEDLKVTVDDLPANFFYTQEKAVALNDAKAAGSLVDFTYLYQHTTDGSITVDGNYFELDLSEIPLVKRDRCRTTELGSVVSHAAAFKAIRGSDVRFQNINMSGNAKNAVSDDDKVYGGGFIFMKGAGSRTFTASNIIATKFFITFMGEDPYYDDGYTTQFNLNKVKCTNNYNSFLYNWGSAITSTASLYSSCGGPIIIQDHTSTDVYETNNGLIIDGNAPTTNFIDCTLENYVAGTEAWFQQFNATALVGQIKSLSDLLYATGFTKSFVVNEQHEGKLFQALAAQSQASLFNFVAFNKSGRAEGLTSVPSCGTVNIVKSDKTDTYDFRQPAFDSVGQAYLAYQANPSQEAQQALIAAAMAKGVSFAPDFSDAEEKITQYITNICTVHGVLRGLNDANVGAPVFDFGPAFELLTYDGANPYLQSALNLAGGAPASMYNVTADQKAATPDYFALYFNGMMLVIALTDYVA